MLEPLPEKFKQVGVRENEFKSLDESADNIFGIFNRSRTSSKRTNALRAQCLEELPQKTRKSDYWFLNAVPSPFEWNIDVLRIWNKTKPPEYFQKKIDFGFFRMKHKKKIWLKLIHSLQFNWSVHAFAMPKPPQFHSLLPGYRSENSLSYGQYVPIWKFVSKNSVEQFFWLKNDR